MCGGIEILSFLECEIRSARQNRLYPIVSEQILPDSVGMAFLGSELFLHALSCGGGIPKKKNSLSSVAEERKIFPARKLQKEKKEEKQENFGRVAHNEVYLAKPVCRTNTKKVKGEICSSASLFFHHPSNATPSSDHPAVSHGQGYHAQELFSFGQAEPHSRRIAIGIGLV